MTARLHLPDIGRVVAGHFKLTKEQLVSQSHKWQFCRPRQMAMSLAREFTTCSTPTIGTYFGGRDHTTVMHATRRIEALEAVNPSIRDHMAALREKFRAMAAEREAAQAEQAPAEVVGEPAQ